MMEGSRSLSGAASGDRYLRQNSSEILAFLGAKGGQVTPPPGTTAAVVANSGVGGASRQVAPFDPSEFPSLGRSTSSTGGSSLGGSGSSAGSGLPMSAVVAGGLPMPQSRQIVPPVSEGLYSESFPALPQVTRSTTLGTSAATAGSVMTSLPQSSVAPSNPFTQAAQQHMQHQVNSRHDMALAGSFGLMGLMGVIRMEDPDRGTLALGTDLTTLGLNLNSSESLHTIFSGPWDDSPRDSLFSLPASYPRKSTIRPEVLEKVNLETLFVCFYSMPRDVLQVLAAQELVNRGWRFHEELRLWFSQAKNGSIVFFDVHAWERRIFSGRLPDGFESGFLSPEIILTASRAAATQLQQGSGRATNAAASASWS